MYIPAFDPFHAIYRLLFILKHFDTDCAIEVDRLRIFDFYLLFPYKAHQIHLKNCEKEFCRLRNERIDKRINPYNVTAHDRRLFARLRAYQTIALRHLASYGLIDPDLLLRQKVKVTDVEKMRQVMSQLEAMPQAEESVLGWLIHCFRDTPLGGDYGLKYRTQLLESKYDDC